MAEEYTPTTDEVRDFAIQAGRIRHPHISDDATGAAFDRWHAETIATVLESLLPDADRPWFKRYLRRAIEDLRGAKQTPSDVPPPITVRPEDEARLIADAKAAGFTPSRLSPNTRQENDRG